MLLSAFFQHIAGFANFSGTWIARRSPADLDVVALTMDTRESLYWYTNYLGSGPNTKRHPRGK